MPSCAANVTYPQEYYILTDQENQVLSSYNWQIASNGADLHMLFREAQRQTILLEMENKLLAEQNVLLANQSLVGHKIICTGSVPGACNEWTVI